MSDGHLSGLISEILSTSILEWLAVTFGVIQVLLAKENKVSLYPAGILATSLSAYILAEAGLYAESGLNLYYLVMSIYGWIHWHRRRGRAALPITRTRRAEWGWCALIVIGGFGLLYLVLDQFTDSTVPVWDSLVSAFAWAGTWLLARRKLENWILLNISNLLAIPLLAYKGLELFSLLTLFLFVVAIFGYFSWKSKMKASQMPLHDK